MISVTVFIYLCGLLLLPINVELSAGLQEGTLKKCCDLGSSSQVSCTNFPTPIPGIEVQDESECLQSMEICCEKRLREMQCEAGISAAQANNSCVDNEAEAYKMECCEACLLGINTGRSGQSCQNLVGSEASLDAIFEKCCEESDISITTALPAITASVSLTTPSVQTTKRDALEIETYDALPPLENLCDIEEVCAQICIPVGDSYRCDCNKGYILMEDKVSCKPAPRKKNPDRCDQNNPCEHICTDTDVAIRCSCKEGYVLAEDKSTCEDIDECQTGEYDCAPKEQCINELGGYYCGYPDIFEPDNSLFEGCPSGYKFNGTGLTCDDIDECEFGIMCPRPKTCINTVGSFKCEEEIPQCPAGFRYKAAIDTCSDIDECITGENNCNKESQMCLNTKGNYTCIDKVSKTSCPAGFKINPYTQTCEDIDECLEDIAACGQHEKCINEPGGHNCIPLTYSTATTITTTTPRSTMKTTTPHLTYITQSTTTKSTTQATTEYSTFPLASCTFGYKYSAIFNRCVDIDECYDEEPPCESTEDCFNTPGSYVCRCKGGYTKDYHIGACIDVNECQIGVHDCSVAERCDNTIGSYLCSRIAGCGTGYTLNYANGLCEDDDECTLGTHHCDQLGTEYRCRNTLGSYRCDAVRTTPLTPRPPLISPSHSTSFYNPVSTTSVTFQTTDATHYITHPTMYNVSLTTSISSTTSKATTGTVRLVPMVTWIPTAHTSTETTPSYTVISGSRKRCLNGYRMNAQGICEDVDECESSPCTRGQKCLNFNGSYQCVASIFCRFGYEINEAADACEDVNECARGTHKCNPTQICKNGEGYYICECPAGHHMSFVSNLCQDIDECTSFYRVCPAQANCVNTVGSYECLCKEGFKEAGSTCADIDECGETSHLCEHNCVNTWGSYRCACQSGFTLNVDNRTCLDVDECEKFKDRRLCVGNCINVPGSYACECPKGYRLGEDGRTCIDIDECEQNVCPRADNICLNTRGSYKCFTLDCPANYYRDPSHKSRCKRLQSICDSRDLECLMLPDQYTSHYISFSSKLPVTHGPIPFFQIKGPHWRGSRVEFFMEIGEVACNDNIERITENHFRLIRNGLNGLQLAIVKPLEGPQEVQLIVKMYIYHSDIVTTHVVFYIYIVVSEYEF